MSENAAGGGFLTRLEDRHRRSFDVSVARTVFQVDDDPVVLAEEGPFGSTQGQVGLFAEPIFSHRELPLNLKVGTCLLVVKYPVGKHLRPGSNLSAC